VGGTETKAGAGSCWESGQGVSPAAFVRDFVESLLGGDCL
jgi:hypothetical protein